MAVLVAADPVPSLEELADTANREHEAAEHAVASWVEHAIRAGEALLLVVDLIPPGTFYDWLRQHFAGDRALANRYMRAAFYAPLLEDAGIRTGDRARTFLQGLPPVRSRGWHVKRRPEERERARRLRAEGLTQAEIAQAVGVHVKTVQTWLSPDLERRLNERNLVRLRAKRADAARKRQEAKDRAVRARGGSTASAYSLIRRAAQQLDRAIANLEHGEERAELTKAYRKLGSAEEDIVRSLGIANGSSARA